MASITLENFQERWSALEADLLKDTRIFKVEMGRMGGGTVYYSDGWLQDCVIEIVIVSKQKEDDWAAYLAELGNGNMSAVRPDTTRYYIGIEPNGSYKTYTSNKFWSRETEKLWPEAVQKVMAVCAEILKS